MERINLLSVSLVVLFFLLIYLIFHDKSVLENTFVRIIAFRRASQVFFLFLFLPWGEYVCIVSKRQEHSCASHGLWSKLCDIAITEYKCNHNCMIKNCMSSVTFSFLKYQLKYNLCGDREDRAWEKFICITMLFWKVIQCCRNEVFRIKEWKTSH